MQTKHKHYLHSKLYQFNFSLIRTLIIPIVLSLGNLVKAQGNIIIPPLTRQSAIAKITLDESVWNSRDPEKIALLYSPQANWRDGNTF